MKLVTGLVSPDSGEIIVFGEKVRGPVKIAGIPESHLLPWCRVIDNVLLPQRETRNARTEFWS